MQPAANSYLSANQATLLPQVNEAWSSVKDVLLATPFTYDTVKDRFVGKINVEGREFPIYYEGKKFNSAKDLEDHTNLDIAIILFNRLVNRGELRTNHLFKAWMGLNHEFLLVVPKEGNFSEYSVVQIATLQDESIKRIYDFALGKLFVKYMDEEVEKFLKGPQVSSNIAPKTLSDINSENAKAYFPVPKLPEASTPICEVLELPVVWITG